MTVLSINEIKVCIEMAERCRQAAQILEGAAAGKRCDRTDEALLILVSTIAKGIESLPDASLAAGGNIVMLTACNHYRNRIG